MLPWSKRRRSDGRRRRRAIKTRKMGRRNGWLTVVKCSNGGNGMAVHIV